MPNAKKVVERLLAEEGETPVKTLFADFKEFQAYVEKQGTKFLTKLGVGSAKEAWSKNVKV